MEKEITEKMIHVCQSLVEMVEMVFRRFPNPSETSLKEGENLRKEVQKYSSDLTAFLVSKNFPREKGREWAKPFLTIASDFDRMGYNIEGIMDRLKTMADENVCFSDRGIKEINDVFRETKDLLMNLPDLIVTQNRLLAQQIKEKGKGILKMADQYSEEHQQRLIEGVCMPKSAPIYLGLLESLKAMTFHILQITEKAVDLP